MSSSQSTPAAAAGTPHGGCRAEVAPTPTGCVIRVFGRGTGRESCVVRDAAMRPLQGNPPATVVLDLTACDYLDSTFLGCLLHLNRAGGAAPGAASRFSIAVPPERRGKLLGGMRLDRIVNCLDVPPDACGPAVALPVAAGGGETKEWARHVMECHRQLAEVESPMRPLFARIADEMARELGR